MAKAQSSSVLDLDDLHFPCDRHGYVYLITFRRPTDGSLFYYVGQRIGNKLSKNYTGSGFILQKYKNKYGVAGNLHLKILNWCFSQDELNFKEILSICMAKHMYGKSCLNLLHSEAAGSHSKATREKLSRAHKGVPLSKEHLASIRANNSSPEFRAKISAAGKGRVPTAKALQNLRAAMQRPEVLEKIGAAKRGLKHTEQHNARISSSMMQPEVQAKLRVKKPMLSVPKEIVECPHCGKSGGKAVMHKWHFDNCAEFKGKRPKDWVDPRAIMSSRMGGRVLPKVTCPHCGAVGGLCAMRQWHFDNCKFKD